MPEFRWESDAELRERLHYVAYEGTWNKMRIDKYIGEDLDMVAVEFCLRRRARREGE